MFCGSWGRWSPVSRACMPLIMWRMQSRELLCCGRYSGELRLLAVDSHRITRVFRNEDKVKHHTSSLAFCASHLASGCSHASWVCAALRRNTPRPVLLPPPTTAGPSSSVCTPQPQHQHRFCVLKTYCIQRHPPANRYIKDSNSGSVSLYGHPFMLQCCRTDSPRTLRSLIQPIAGVRRDACCTALHPADYPPGSSIRLRRLDPSLKPLSFDSVSQISTASALNGDAGLEWLGLERVSEGSQQDGREANEVMVAAEAAAAAAPMSARLMQQQQQAAPSLRLSSDPPSVPLSARVSGGAGGVGGVSQPQPLSARARVPVALVRGGGSRNTDVVPDDDAANPQPAASRSQQQHPRLNVVLSGAQAGVQPRVPSLDLAAVNAAAMAPPPPAAAAAAAGGHVVGDSGAEVISDRRIQNFPQASRAARADHAAVAGSVGARVGEAAPGSARVEGVSGGAGHRDVKRDVVSSSNISELRSKVISCQEEVQKMKEYALELEQDNASLKQVRRAAARQCRPCSKL